MARKYKTPRFPDEFYLSEMIDGQDVDLGRFLARDFVPYEPDKGAIVNWQWGERPIILRVTKQSGNVLSVVDGTGESFEYLITPVE